MFDAPWHWVILAVVVIALFGYKRLPDASRSLGRSLRIFKSEIKGLTEDDKAREAAAQAVTPAPASAAVADPAAVVQPTPTPVVQSAPQPAAPAQESQPQA